MDHILVGWDASTSLVKSKLWPQRRLQDQEKVEMEEDEKQASRSEVVCSKKASTKGRSVSKIMMKEGQPTKERQETKS